MVGLRSKIKTPAPPAFASQHHEILFTPPPPTIKRTKYHVNMNLLECMLEHRLQEQVGLRSEMVLCSRSTLLTTICLLKYLSA